MRMIKSFFQLILFWAIATNDGVVAQIPEVFPQIHHSSVITASALHPNGRWMATGGGDNAILIWDILEKKVFCRFDGHFGSIQSLSFYPHPDSTLLVSSAEDDDNIRFWDLKTGKQRESRRVENGMGLEQVQFSRHSAFQDDSVFLHFIGYERFDVYLLSGKQRYGSFSVPEKMMDGKSGAAVRDESGVKFLDAFLTSGRLSMLRGGKKYALRKDSTLYIVDAKQFRVEDSLKIGSYILDIDYLSGTEMLGVATGTGIEIWDMKTKTLKKKLFSGKSIYQIDFSDGGTLLYYKWEKGIGVIDRYTDKILITWEEPEVQDAFFVLADEYLLLNVGQAPRLLELERAVFRDFSTYNRALAKTAFSPDGRFLAFSSEGENDPCIYLLDRQTLEIKRTRMTFPRIITSLGFGPGATVIAGCADLNFYVFESSDLSLKRRIYVGGKGEGLMDNRGDFFLSDFCFSGDSTFLYFGVHSKVRYLEDGTPVYKLNWKTGEIAGRSKNLEGFNDKISISPDGNYLITTSTDHLYLLNPGNLSIKKQTKLGKDIYFYDNFSLSPDTKTLLTTAYGNILLYTFPGLKEIQRYTYPLSYAWGVEFVKDSLVAVAGGFYDANTYLFDPFTQDLLQKDDAHVGDVNSMSICKDLVATCGSDSRLILRNREGKILLTLSMLPGKEASYLMFTPDGYFAVSKEAREALCFVQEQDIYHIDRFDLGYNRHEILLERIGQDAQQRIQMFRKLHDKRVANAETGAGIWDPADMPSIERRYFPLRTDRSHHVLRVIAKAGKSPISAIQIRVNGVPIFGKKGLMVSEGSLAIDTLIHIPLTPGDQYIEYSVYNSRGIESQRPGAWIFCDPKEEVKGSLYMVAFSVSNYKDSSYNLRYAVKDGKDILESVKYSRLGIGMQDPEFVGLYDERVNRENFIKLQDLLKKTKAEDRVIVFLSGHGVLDEDLNFYFAGHATNFNQVAETAIPYTMIEAVFDSIPARQRLLLMDACHSGLVDKSNTTEQNFMAAVAVPSGSRGAKASQLKQGDAQVSFDLMRELFSDMSKESGVQVISAAAGDSYALESEEWNNGVFTYALIQALDADFKTADVNRNGELSLSEWSMYVSNKVTELTKGRQKPTSRSWNPHMDFVVEKR